MKGIKLFDGVKVTYKGEEQTYSSTLDLWKLFNWDIENDTDANKSATEVTRYLLMMNELTLFDVENIPIKLELIPCKESELD